MVMLGSGLALAAPGKEREITAAIGTKSATGHTAMIRIDRNLAPKTDIHPVAEITFPAKPGGAKPAPVTLSLDERCCNVRFFAKLKTPATVGAGKATVTLSFSGWKDTKVASTTKVCEVAENALEKRAGP